MSGEQLLELSHISKTFPGVKALDGIALSLRRGEVHALLGENGAGKSTLIKIITGVLQPDPGARIVFGGQPVTRNSPEVAQQCGVAAIYQHPTLFPSLTVAENLMIGREGPVIHWKQRREHAAQCLAHVGADLPLDAPVGNLRMAEKQLLEMARALSQNARILIMDEPTASLPQKDADHLLALIADLRRQGVGIIYITHRLEEVQQIADRMTILRDGKLVGEYDAGSLDRAGIIRLMAGRPLEDMYHKEAIPVGAEVLAVKDLSSRADNLRGIRFSLHEGEILGVAGLVGAGRTELARALFGITPADGGEICMHGKPVVIKSPADAIAHGIAYVPEDRHQHGIIQDFAVADNITLPILRQLCKGGCIQRKQAIDTAAAYTRKLRVKTPSLFTLARNLSGGNQQKVVLSRWMATKPRVLILDEPTQGIDVGSKAEIYTLMEQLAREGVAILMISSELPEILGMSDRIAVMCRGELTAILPRTEATQEKILEYAMEKSLAVQS